MADLLKTIEGIATVTIALYVASIGTFQWLAARQKLRLDLYNRRFDVYVHAISFMQALMEWASLTEEVKRERRVDFIRAARESRFLFADDRNIFDLLEEINQRSFKVMGISDEIAVKAVGGRDRAELRESIRPDLEWIIAATERLAGTLVQYLAFGRSAIKRPTVK